jgi:hypothetical protein
MQVVVLVAFVMFGASFPTCAFPVIPNGCEESTHYITNFLLKIFKSYVLTKRYFILTNFV